MKRLLFVSSSDGEIINHVIKNMDNPDAVIITTNPSVHKFLTRRKSRCVVIDPSMTSNKIKRDDSEFAELAMPGVLEGRKMADSDLDLWKAVSIDRFRAWFMPSQGLSINSLLRSSEYDEFHSSCDFGSPFFWSIAKNARATKKIIYASEPIRTREMIDLFPFIQEEFDLFVINTESELVTLRVMGYTGEIECLYEDDPPVIPMSSNQALISSMSPTGRGVLAVFYDKRDDRQFSIFATHWIPNMASQYDRIIFFPTDQRSAQLYESKTGRRGERFTNENLPLLEIPSLYVAFRWDDNYCMHIRNRLKILDFNGINSAFTLHHRDAEVVIV